MRGGSGSPRARRIDRRALDRRALTLLYVIFAGAADEALERRLGNADRVALGRLLKARLVTRQRARYVVGDAVRFGLEREA